MQHTQWLNTLPLLLLGIRSSLKEDPRCTTTKLLYVTTMHLPGELFDTTDNYTVPAALCFTFTLYLATTSTDTNITPYNQLASSEQNLSTCTHVFLHRDAMHNSLLPAYEGLFKVLERPDKFFVVLVNGQRQTITLHRFKPAHLDSQLASSPPQLFRPSTHPPVQVPVHTRLSGRRVHFLAQAMTLHPAHWEGGVLWCTTLTTYCLIVYMVYWYSSLFLHLTG